MLMDYHKAHIRKTYPGTNHILTCADNYAVGYFRKQGFSKGITMNNSLWFGYIKDYAESVLMECALLPKMDYLRVKEATEKQLQVVVEKITQNSKSHIVHAGLTWWKDGNTGPIDPRLVPGLCMYSSRITILFTE